MEEEGDEEMQGSVLIPIPVLDVPAVISDPGGVGTDKVPDITVNQRNFCPANPVGPTLAPGRWTPLALFKYFFPDNSVSIICRNTNANAAKNQLSGKSTHGLILHGWCRKPYRLEGGTGQDQHQNVVAS